MTAWACLVVLLTVGLVIGNAIIRPRVFEWLVGGEDGE